MSKQHTLWQVGRLYKNVVFDNKGDIAADCHSPQIAKFIVKACNNHDRLVEALEELINGTNILDARVKANQLLTELKE